MNLFGDPDVERRAMGGHQSPESESEVWLTPPDVLGALGAFDLDPAACMEPRPWPTAERHYTKADNGLLLPWVGRVWLNPPYGGPLIVSPWLRRLADHGNGIALVFARTETGWFHESIWQRASAVFFFAGRLHFHYPDGRRAAGNAGAPSCLAAYGAFNVSAIRVAAGRGSIKGRLVTL